ncbi:MAG: hypothetical protein ACK5V0_02580, partial [Alphaproteobacteria bacterium]
VINDAGMHERGMLHWVEHPEVGRVCLPFSPLRFGDTLTPGLKPSPFSNQHQEEVVRGILGFRRKNGSRCGKRGRLVRRRR